MSNAAGSRTDAQIVESLHLCRHPHICMLLEYIKGRITLWES